MPARHPSPIATSGGTGTERGAGAKLARQVLLTLMILAAIDTWVNQRLFEEAIRPRYVTPFALLRDRSGSRQWSILFDELERRPRPPVRIGLFGDSTIHTTEDLGDQFAIAFFLNEEMQRRFGTSVEIVDFSQFGMFAGETAIDIAKAIDHVDLLVWGATIRAFPSDPVWLSSLPRDVGVAEVRRMLSVGAAGWLIKAFDPMLLLEGSVRSIWKLYAYRTQLKLYAYATFFEPLLQDQPTIRTQLAPNAPPPIQFLSGNKAKTPYIWMKADYLPPGANWDALTAVGRLCQRYAPDRCLLYAGAINPTDRELLAEPGLEEAYLARLRIEAGRHDLMWRDFTDIMTADEFRKPKFWNPVDPIHLNRKGGAKLARLLADILEPKVRELLGGVWSAPRICPPRSPFPPRICKPGSVAARCGLCPDLAALPRP